MRVTYTDDKDVNRTVEVAALVGVNDDGTGSFQGMVGNAAKVNVPDTVTVRQELDIMAYTENDRITITASTTPVPTWDISWADEVTVSCATGGAETIKIEVSLDGTNFSTISPSGRDSLDGTYESCAALANKMVTIPFNGKKVRFTASAAIETHTIDWSARNSGRGAV